MELKGIHLANEPPSSTYDVRIEDGKISSIQPSNSDTDPNGKQSILLPSLCHPHVHLDKAFLLSSDYPQYADLVPTEGTFKEALSNTAMAKERYTRDDLLRRGSQLIAESIKAGVTAMRAFVEVDHVVRFLCLEVACMLKKRFRRVCYMQIVAFAQDPIFSSGHGDENRSLLDEALTRKEGFGIDVLGTTPYVESDTDSAHRNIDWAIRKALQHDLHLDFHLDYNLDEATPPMINHMLDTLQRHNWPRKQNSGSGSHASSTPDPKPKAATKTKPKSVALAHCTRLTLLPSPQLNDLTTRILASALPLSLVALPTSDLYMMGRPPTPNTPLPPKPLASQRQQQQQQLPLTRPRGTLPLPLLSSPPHSLAVALGINNLSNPFTPFGTADPLIMLACWGVGVYQEGTEEGARKLYGWVSEAARRAVGLGVGVVEVVEDASQALGVQVGDIVDVEGRCGGEGRGLVLFEGEAEGQMEIELDPAGDEGGEGEREMLKVTVPGRGIRTVRDVVWCPPETGRRRVIIR